MSVTIDFSDGLKKALEFANARAIYQNQLHLAKLRFDTAKTFVFAGGHFRSSPEMIGYLQHRVQSGREWSIVEDTSGLPIRIDDIQDFLDTMSSQYHQALNGYWEEVQRLRSSRDPQVMLGANLGQ